MSIHYTATVVDADKVEGFSDYDRIAYSICPAASAVLKELVKEKILREEENADAKRSYFKQVGFSCEFTHAIPWIQELMKTIGAHCVSDAGCTWCLSADELENLGSILKTAIAVLERGRKGHTISDEAWKTAYRLFGIGNRRGLLNTRFIEEFEKLVAWSIKNVRRTRWSVKNLLGAKPKNKKVIITISY